VVVDETSMVSLSLMARLVEAVRPEARLILVGDPAQLASIEAGVVLGDIVGPAADLDAGAALEDIVGPAADVDAGAAIAAGIVVLDRVHRYGGGIAALADAIRRGDGDRAVTVLSEAPAGVTWLRVDVGETHYVDSELALVRSRAVAAGSALFEAARAGAGIGALSALGGFRLLCAHRRGPYGVSDWTSRVVAWLSASLSDLDVEQRDYIGRPLLVTENDYELGLYNGDTGAIVQAAAGQPVAVFERGGELLHFSPLRLGAADTVYAMTIHKSQGSQFETAAVLLPSAAARILTRELLYTAVTRAREELILVGSEEAIRVAVARPVARASGLRERLWTD
jgi:exodeoxyribonuclease V alpha subunit